MIKIVDIFAGPGGLSEGFSAVLDNKGRQAFEIVLSIEVEENAYQTLFLRSFFRKFDTGSAPNDYYSCLRGELSLSDLYKAYPKEAKAAEAQCWRAKLGPGGEQAQVVRKRIKEAVGNNTSWVLIGGPPCQAYSLVGRSRNLGNPAYDPEKDERQRLYVEYLQILADHRPAVFIMENVKGLLSATLENKRIFHGILEDLRNPAAAIAREGRGGGRNREGGYRICSLVEPRLFDNGNIEGAVIQSERYGIPQMRHRVILFGIRDDIKEVIPKTLHPQSPVSLSAVVNGLPRLRSGLSRISDTAETWRQCLTSQINSRWANGGARRADSEELRSLIRRTLKSITLPAADRGGEFVPGDIQPEYAKDWYVDRKLGGVCNHESRLHMESDLFRYLYASCYAKLHGKSPSLEKFPKDLLPDHYSAKEAVLKGGNFSDRFRVQIGSRPSTTIVSHVSKDGHYYIHPDPLQCRSLTVREAARLQTFPDNYFFCGNRTAQYTQVGNAVPPLLARQIGEIVHDLLKTAGAND